MHIVYETLDMLGVKDKKIVTLFNKLDKVEENELIHDFKADKTLKISAKSGEGLTQFKEILEEILREDKKLLEGTFPYDQGGQLTIIRKYGELLEEEYRENGIYVKAFVPIEIYSNLENSMNYSENIHSTENS